MANIKKGARAYYADTDYRRDGMNEAYSKIDSMPSIPTPEESDSGKVIKVNDSGVYSLSDDLHTPVVANPEGTPSAELNTISIGDTIYKVNDARVTKLLALRFTIDNGGTYNANLPQISLVNEYGEAAVLPTNTMTCDKPVQYGALTPTGTPGVLTENLPAKFTLTFAAEFNVEDFPNIKLTQGGLFSSDVAKNIKIEYSLNGTDYVEIADLVSIDWTNTTHIYDMSTGEETTTTPAIPTPTTADAGKVLGVDNNGEWALNTPSIDIILSMTIQSGVVTWHCDKTFSEIQRLFDEGYELIFCRSGKRGSVFHITSMGSNDFEISNISVQSDSNYTLSTIVFDDQNNGTQYTYTV